MPFYLEHERELFVPNHGSKINNKKGLALIFPSKNYFFLASKTIINHWYKADNQNIFSLSVEWKNVKIITINTRSFASILCVSQFHPLRHRHRVH